MIHRVLALLAVFCCALVVVSFALFARDQAAVGSQHQQSELASGHSSPSPVPVARPEAQPRRFIDGAAGNLTSPFTSIMHSDNPWVRHGVPTLIALLVYGVGLGYLARFSSGLP